MSYISDKVKESVSPMEVAKRLGIHLNRKGFALCPFHTEKTPSCFFDPWPGGRFHCYGCGADGDSIALVKKVLNVEYKDAIQELNKMFNLGVLDEKTYDKSANNDYMLAKMIKKRKQAIREYEEKPFDLNEALDRHCRYHQELKSHPASWEEMSDLFIEALQNMDELSYKIDLEIDRQHELSRNKRG